MESKPVYIYGLFDPRDSSLRYIGKSINPERRLYEHVLESLREAGNSSFRVGWIKHLLSIGLEPELEILEECDETNWQQAEIDWIAECKANGLQLVNLTPGGESPPRWDEMCDPVAARQKLKESRRKRTPPNLGKKWSDEYKKKMSQALSGSNNPMYGKFGKDHPKTGKKDSPEEIARKRSVFLGERNPMYGKTHSDAAKAKLSKAGKGRRQSATDRAKKSLSERLHHALKRGDFNQVILLNQKHFESFGYFHPKYPG